MAAMLESMLAVTGVMARPCAAGLAPMKKVIPRRKRSPTGAVVTILFIDRYIITSGTYVSDPSKTKGFVLRGAAPDAAVWRGVAWRGETRRTDTKKG